MSLLPIVTATDPGPGITAFDGAAAAGDVPSGSGFVVATGSTGGALAGSGVEVPEGGEAAPGGGGAGAMGVGGEELAGSGVRTPIGGGTGLAGGGATDATGGGGGAPGSGGSVFST
jgi:hypothetical protein